MTVTMIYVYELNAHIKFVMKVLPIVMFHCHIKKNQRMVFLDLIATINISRNVISRWTYQENQSVFFCLYTSWILFGETLF